MSYSSTWKCRKSVLDVTLVQMLRLTSSKDQNVQIPGTGMSAVPHTADFLVLIMISQ